MPNFGSIIPQLLVIDPIGTYGCAFDHRVVFDGATTGGTGVITSPALANFTNQDVGKRIVLTGAGASGAMYAGTITSLNSSTSVNVTPNTTTTVSAKGLQIHTDDLPAWTNLITDLNNSVYPGGIILIRAAWTSTGFTNRSGISGFLPAINKQIILEGIAGGHTADTGDYTKVGGSCLAYAGLTVDSGVPFGAMMTIVPTTGTTAQAIKQVSIQHFWFDCRNGDGNAALKALWLQSCHGWNLDDVFVNDAGAVAYAFSVVGPGLAVPNAGSLGEAKDCTRGRGANVSSRLLEPPAAGFTSTPTTTTTAITLTATGQSLTLAAANGLPATGYIWVMSAQGTPVLVNYTGGGGTTTLTGCTVSATDIQYSYTTASGSNVVQACPANACTMHFDGDATANTCLNHLDTLIVSQGSTWGPAALEFCNCDSIVVTNLVINGGSATVTNATNRVTKPGVRFNGHIATTIHARNNQMIGGSPGPGGVSAMGLTSAGAILAFPSGPNYWDLQQLANGEPVPTRETITASATQGAAGAFIDWTPNGGFRPGRIGSPALTTQTISATTALVAGTLVAVPQQGFQIGTVISWVIPCSKTAAGTATRTIAIKYGALGSSSDTTTIATASYTPTAVADQGTFYLELVITALGSGTSATALGQFSLIHTSATAVGLGANAITPTMAGFNSTLPAAGPAYLSVVITTGTSEVLTILPPVYAQCISPGSP